MCDAKVIIYDAKGQKFLELPCVYQLPDHANYHKSELPDKETGWPYGRVYWS